MLRAVAGLETFRLPLSSVCRSMRLLGSIVEAAVLSMLDIRQQASLRHAKASLRSSAAHTAGA
jgi:hypothetical protein